MICHGEQSQPEGRELSPEALTWFAVIPSLIAFFTVSLSSLPTIRLGYLVLMSMNRFRIAISSSLAAAGTVSDGQQLREHTISQV